MKFEITATPIRLKIIGKDDCANLHLLRTDVDVAKFILRDTNQSISDIEKFIEAITSDLDKILFYKIEMISTLELVGAICLKNINHKKRYAEVGYELFPKFQHQGLMTIALDSIIDMAFANLDLDELEAFTHRDNRNSRSLLEKFKFKQTDKVDAKNSNNVIYSLKRSFYAAKK
jgi:ribosomal-protein-alanine N-acetyltransferase